jgi:GAF domain-containing protein
MATWQRHVKNESKSQKMTTIQKHEKYQQATREINAILEGETNMILKMSTINCILRIHLDYYFWVGFYCVNNGGLIVGPYQGTLGCLHISFERGICGRAAKLRETQLIEDVHCGRAAKLRETQLIEDVHADSQHIACDSRTNSEIVVPVFNPKGDLIAVFDVDSTEAASFDKVDKQYLEQIITQHFELSALQETYI